MRPPAWPSSPPALPTAPNLEDTDEGLGKVVERAAPHFHVLKIKLAPKELHAQQGKNYDEEEEEEEQRGNGAD